MPKSTVLWVSLRVPYDSVAHAGGKVHNYYIKMFHKSGIFDIQLLTFCREDEKDKIDLDEYGIKYEAITISKNENQRKKLERLGFPPSLFEYFYVREKVKERLRKLADSGYQPDFVFLQWTEIVLLFSYAKHLFPLSKIVCIEEDVTFLKLQRKVWQNRGIRRALFWIQEKMMEKQELDSLIRADLDVLNNYKDYNLILQHGVSKDRTFVTAPFFNNLCDIERHSDGRTVVFWGAMNRTENEEAAIWFIEEVVPLLGDIRFVVIGAHPSEKMKSFSSEHILITGFVDDPKSYFETCLCMVVPLKNGAGIKIKVLEGMSAGIPILTNDIGIEGIPARDGKEYFHCETANDYSLAIQALKKDELTGENIGLCARLLIKNNFDFHESVVNFMKRVSDMDANE